MAYKINQPSMAICIPTYKRVQLLKVLLEDLSRQALQPALVIVVDGDPDSGAVLKTLSSQIFSELTAVIYLPSNHANLAYQRYLGWRAATAQDAGILIYFDDDQRIYQSDVLEWLSRPLRPPNSEVVGVGCYSRSLENTAVSHLSAKRESHWLVEHFGSERILGLLPGQLTPVGHRVGLVDDGRDYVETDWLQGRVMAYRTAAMSQQTFSEDLFAQYELRIGRAEDTFLSRRVGANGKLLYTFRAVVDHPNADTPKAYPYEAYRYVYAATYSRRFLNDYYRVYNPPTRSDRWALVKSYVGNAFLSWLQVLKRRNTKSLALARGTTLGAIHGLTRPPIAKRLTPDIDWWGDAEKVLASALTVQHSARVANR